MPRQPVKKAGRPGPRPRGPYVDKRKTITTRITESTRRHLEQGAAESDRSLSQEIELRLERSRWDDEHRYEMVGGKDVYALLTLAGEAARIVMGGTRLGYAGSYADDLDQSIRLRAAFRKIFDEMAPTGTPTMPIKELQEQGEATAAVILKGGSAREFLRDPNVLRDPGKTTLTTEPRTPLSGVLRPTRKQRKK